MPSSASGGAWSAAVRRRYRPSPNIGGSRVSGAASAAGAGQKLVIAFHSASAWAWLSVNSLALFMIALTSDHMASVGAPTHTVSNSRASPRYINGLTHRRLFRFGRAGFGNGGGTTTVNSGSIASHSARSNSAIDWNRSAGSLARAFRHAASTPVSIHG